MFIITDVNDVIVYKSRTGVVVEGGFLVDGDTLTWAVPGCHMFEVDAIPDGHGISQSCYTEENGFYANPDYVEPKTSIDDLIAENAELKTKIGLLEDCVAELSAQMFA